MPGKPEKAYLSIEQVLDKKYITDTSIAQALVNGELDLTDDIVVAHVHQIGAYQEVYVGPADDLTTKDVNEKEQAAEVAANADADMLQEAQADGGDHDDSNDINFTIAIGSDPATSYTYKGSPKTKIKNALISLGVSVDGVTGITWSHDNPEDPEGEPISVSYDSENLGTFLNQKVSVLKGNNSGLTISAE